jgi:hypothetical protein
MFSNDPMCFCRTGDGVEATSFTFKRSIRAEVVTYRLDVAFGSLHTQQLHEFDELCNDQRIIQNGSASIDTTVASLYLLASSFSFRILRQAKKIQGWLPGSQGFGWRALSRNPHIQFTRELFLHVADVHIWLESCGNILFRLSWSPSERSKTCFLFARFFGASRRIRKLRDDAGRQSDETVALILTLRFWMIPWSLSDSSKPRSCCVCRDPKTTSKRYVTTSARMDCSKVKMIISTPF